MDEFLTRVENILNTKSGNELKAFLEKLAAKTPAEEQQDFLTFLEDRRVTISKDVGVADFDAQKVMDRVCNLLENVLEYEIDAHFYESYEWEQYDYGGWHPAGWNIESDGGFSDEFYRCYIGAVRILEHGLYGDAAVAFTVLLKIIATFDEYHEADDEGALYFETLVDENWLEIDTNKLKGLRCYSALMAQSQDAYDDDADAVSDDIFDLISKAGIMFNEVLNIGSEPVPDIQAVFKRWVSILHKKPPEIAAAYIKEIAMSSNAPEIMEEYVNTAGEKEPRAYMALCDLYTEQCDARTKIIAAATTGLQRTAYDAKNRVELANLLAVTAKEAGDDRAYRYAIAERFCSCSTLKSFIPILEYGAPEVIEAAIKESEQGILDGTPGTGYVSTSQRSIDSYIIRFWNGDYAHVFDAMKRDSPGYSFGYGFSDRILPFFIGRLAGFGETAEVIKSLIKDTAGDDAAADILYNSLRENMGPVSKEHEIEWLDYCVKRVGGQANIVLSEQQRDAYKMAARLLAAIGEMQTCRGEENPFQLLNAILEKYPKHNAFKKAVREVQSISRFILPIKTGHKPYT